MSPATSWPRGQMLPVTVPGRRNAIRWVPGPRGTPSAPARNVVCSSWTGGWRRGTWSGCRSAWPRWADGPQESGPQVFPGCFQPGRAPEALFRVRDKVTRPLPGRVQLRDRLVQVHADPPHQQRGPVQGVEGVPQRRVRRRDRAARDREGGFGRVRAAGQPGLAGGGRHLGVLLVGQREPYCAATPSLLPGPAARPGAGRLAVVTNLIIVKNVRHEPLSFLAASPARMRREFPALSPAGFFQYASGTAPGPNGKERY